MGFPVAMIPALMTSFAAIGKISYEIRKQREWKIQIETNQATQMQLEADLGVEQYLASAQFDILASKLASREAELARGQLLIAGSSVILLVSTMVFITQLKKVS